VNQKKNIDPHSQKYLPRINFEHYKDRYQTEIQKSISFIKQSHDFFTLVKVRYLLKTIERHLGATAGLKVLDLGCGVGITDQHLKGKFAKLHGVDIGKGIVQKAAKLNPEVSYKFYDGKKLPFKDETMDVTFAICVLHHVPLENLKAFTAEMKRVTKKGGIIVIFEHNPLNPLTLRAVNQCDLDEDAILLSSGKTKRLLGEQGMDLVEGRYILFTPWGGFFFEWLDRFLGWLPLGAQYYVVGRK